MTKKELIDRILYLRSILLQSDDDDLYVEFLDLLDKLKKEYNKLLADIV